MKQKIDFYKEMRQLEIRCYDETIRIMEEAGIESLPLVEDEMSDEVSVLLYDDCDGGATKHIVTEVRLIRTVNGSHGLSVIDEVGEEIGLHDMADCNLIYIYEAVYGRCREMDKNNNATDSK